MLIISPRNSRSHYYLAYYKMINILYAGARKFVNNHRIKYLVPILHRQFKGCPVYLRKWYSSSAQTIAPSNTTAGGNATAKDLLVFRYENPRFFKYLNFFAIVQFMFWNYLSYFSFTSLKDTPVPQADDSLPWWRRINLGDNKYRNGITIMCFLIGKCMCIWDVSVEYKHFYQNLRLWCLGHRLDVHITIRTLSCAVQKW